MLNYCDSVCRNFTQPVPRRDMLCLFEPENNGATGHGGS